LVFSSLVDRDLGGTQGGGPPAPGTGTFNGGVQSVDFTAQGVIPDANGNPANPTHQAVVTIYEACWFNSWSATFSQDSGMIMESGDVTISDVYDFSSTYGEFIATGNDPTIGQLGSVRYQTP